MARTLPALRSRTIGLLLVTVLAFGALLYAEGVWPPFARAGAPLQLIVHAGDMTVAPENSLEAVLAAIDNGADGVEVDVAQSSDGTWWLMHSGQEIDDTTTGHGNFSDLSDAQIDGLRIDGGIGYRPEMGTSLRIPRLSEVLEAVREWHGILQLDSSELTRESAADLAHLWSAAPFPGTKVIISRFPEGPSIIKAVDPAIRTLLIANPLPPADDPSLDAWLTEGSTVTRPDVIALRSFDVEIYTYFERYGQDESQELERAWRWGATAFLTWNLPEARTIVSELATQGR